MRRFLWPNLSELAEPTLFTTQSIDAHRESGKVFKPKSVMVWTGISGLENTKLVFIPKDVKINIKTYQELILEGAIIPWAQEKAKSINR